MIVWRRLTSGKSLHGVELFLSTAFKSVQHVERPIPQHSTLFNFC